MLSPTPSALAELDAAADPDDTATEPPTPDAVAVPDVEPDASTLAPPTADAVALPADDPALSISSSNATDAPVPSVCTQLMFPVAPAVVLTALACEHEQSLPLVLTPSNRSLSDVGSVAVYVSVLSVSLLVMPMNRHTNEPARETLIPACVSFVDALVSPTAPLYGVPEESAPLYGVTPPDADPVQPLTVIVLLAVRAVARRHQTVSAPLPEAF